MKDIKVISFRFNPLSAQAGKPVLPDSLGGFDGISVERHFCKRLFGQFLMGIGPPVRHEK
jgi:hypothetical protein